MNHPRRPFGTMHRWLLPPSVKGRGTHASRRWPRGKPTHSPGSLDLFLDTRPTRRPRNPPDAAGEGSSSRTCDHADTGAKTTTDILVVK